MNVTEREASPVRWYLVRHAIAGARGPLWPDDTKRPVTPRGVKRMAQAVRGLRAFGVHVDVVMTSPLVRARQTADLLVEGLRHTPDLVIEPALGPGVATARLGAVLTASLSGRAAVALVGHEPALGRFAAWLIGARAPVPFKKGGVGRIDLAHGVREGSGQLIWLATPKMLRALAGAKRS